jgi:hypothetical protein
MTYREEANGKAGSQAKNRRMILEVMFGRPIWVQALHNSLSGANLALEVTALHTTSRPHLLPIRAALK